MPHIVAMKFRITHLYIYMYLAILHSLLSAITIMPTPQIHAYILSRTFLHFYLTGFIGM